MGLNIFLISFHLTKVFVEYVRWAPVLTGGHVQCWKARRSADSSPAGSRFWPSPSSPRDPCPPPPGVPGFKPQPHPCQWAPWEEAARGSWALPPMCGPCPLWATWIEGLAWRSPGCGGGTRGVNQHMGALCLPHKSLKEKSRRRLESREQIFKDTEKMTVLFGSSKQTWIKDTEVSGRPAPICYKDFETKTAALWDKSECG